MNDYGKPQNDMAHQDEQAHELIEQLDLLETVDRHITPEHVARRFCDLLDDIGNNDLPGPAIAEHLRRVLSWAGSDGQPTGVRRKYDADQADLIGSMEATIAAARGAAAEIIADAQLKAKASTDELRRAREAVAAARQQAEQIVAEARAEAEKALELAVKMVRDARNQAEQIISEACDKAEQLTIAAITRTSADWPLIFDTADMIASEVSPAEDEARLRRPPQEAGHHPEAKAAGQPRRLEVSEMPDHDTAAVTTVEAETATVLLTKAEVASMFRVESKVVTRWAKAGKLTSIRTLGGHRRYRETEVRALLAGLPQQRSE